MSSHEDDDIVSVFEPKSQQKKNQQAKELKAAVLSRKLKEVFCWTCYLDWKLQERSLRMTEYNCKTKTGEKIHEFVETNLKDPYGVTEALCHNALFVTDGASNMVKAFGSFPKLQ
ncbi:hypothetical protein BV898_10484 [Hypsibius exemplaris]|uniref:Uncharacterized protein n=1 Tax=Hypsibius exemplaris TaxID=2072580 RepID=A0A1W0WJH8_HYPEX|nr:hypothetical protein BV898_10484 [Hypsibius exemplaris]